MGRKRTLTLRPSDIRYSQCDISNRFTRGGRIDELLDDIINGRCDAASVKKINVAKVDGKWVSDDNRRLWVFKQLESKNKIQSVSVKRVDKITDGKLTTYNKGASIRIRGGLSGEQLSEGTESTCETDSDSKISKKRKKKGNKNIDLNVETREDDCAFIGSITGAMRDGTTCIYESHNERSEKSELTIKRKQKKSHLKNSSNISNAGESIKGGNGDKSPCKKDVKRSDKSKQLSDRKDKVKQRGVDSGSLKKTKQGNVPQSDGKVNIHNSEKTGTASGNDGGNLITDNKSTRNAKKVIPRKPIKTKVDKPGANKNNVTSNSIFDKGEGRAKTAYTSEKCSLIYIQCRQTESRLDHYICLTDNIRYVCTNAGHRIIYTDSNGRVNPNPNPEIMQQKETKETKCEKKPSTSIIPSVKTDELKHDSNTKNVKHELEKESEVNNPVTCVTKKKAQRRQKKKGKNTELQFEINYTTSILDTETIKDFITVSKGDDWHPFLPDFVSSLPT